MKRYRVYLMNGQAKLVEAEKTECLEGWIIFYKNNQEFDRWNGGTVARIETMEEEQSESKIISP